MEKKTMGGKNHQPCRAYLPDSTRMSRDLSVARARLELANVELEDVILIELEGGSGTIAPMLEHLHASSNALNDALKSVTGLRTRMDDNQFEDLPTLHSIDLNVLGASLSDQLMVEIYAWNTVSSIMLRGGFYAMLDTIETGIRALLDKTIDLTNGVQGLDDTAKTAEVEAVLEQNRAGNIRGAFAVLYTTWAKFDNLFLASSVMSTELWYAFTGVGSMGSVTIKKAVA